jgi:hypothetical protein
MSRNRFSKVTDYLVGLIAGVVWGICMNEMLTLYDHANKTIAYFLIGNYCK